MKKLRKFIVYILRANNDHDIREFPAKPMKIFKFTFDHKGHKYEFDAERSFIVHPIENLMYWLTPDRFTRYDRLMVFKEPLDPHAYVDTPVMALTVPSEVSTIEESPSVLRAITRSKLKATYRAKQRFPSLFNLGAIPWWAWLLLAGAIVFALVMSTGGLPSLPPAYP